MQIDGFTDQQVQALEKAFESLGEHFEGVLVAVSTEVPVDDFTAEPARVYWTGGYFKALGMAEYATHKMLRKYTQSSKVPGEGEE